MNKALASIAIVVGRLALGLIFLMSGFGKLTDFAGTSAYMASKGMVMIPMLLVGAIAFELVGGVLLATGFRPRWGALILIVFLIPTTLIFHNFWTLPLGEQRGEMINFLKNLSILGGLLVVAGGGDKAAR